MKNKILSTSFETYEISKYVLLEALREDDASEVRKWAEDLDKEYSWICKAWSAYKDKVYDEDWLKEVGTDYSDIKERTQSYLSKKVYNQENLFSTKKIQFKDKENYEEILQLDLPKVVPATCQSPLVKFPVAQIKEKEIVEDAKDYFEELKKETEEESDESEAEREAKKSAELADNEETFVVDSTDSTECGYAADIDPDKTENYQAPDNNQDVYVSGSFQLRAEELVEGEIKLQGKKVEKSGDTINQVPALGGGQGEPLAVGSFVRPGTGELELGTCLASMGKWRKVARGKGTRTSRRSRDTHLTQIQLKLVNVVNMAMPSKMYYKKWDNFKFWVPGKVEAPIVSNEKYCVQEVNQSSVVLASVEAFTTKLSKKMGQEAEVFINVENAYHTQLGGDGCDFYNLLEDVIWDPGGMELLFVFSSSFWSVTVLQEGSQ